MEFKARVAALKTRIPNLFKGYPVVAGVMLVAGFILGVLICSAVS